MSLLASLKKLRNFIKPGLIALIPVFLGCDAANDFGTEFDLDTGVDVKLIEFDLPSSNLRIDSLRTDNENRVLVGSFTDLNTGNVTAEGYFQYAFTGGILPVQEQTSANPDPTDSLEYDSLYLELRQSELIPFRESSQLAFDVIELVDTLLSTVVYLGSKSETPLRTIGSYDKEVNSSDTVYRVRLNDAFGQEFFNTVSNVVEDSTLRLLNYRFRDMGLVPTAGSTGLTAVDLSNLETQLILYMSGNAPDTSYRATFNTTGLAYSHITRDRTGSLFDGIEEKTNFNLADGRTVLDPLAGLTTTFELSPLRSFFEENPNILINSVIVQFDYEEFVSRDTLDVFRLYFRTQDGGIFGPAVAQDPFSNIVMNDAAYLSPVSGGAVNNDPILGALNSTDDHYIANPTIFFQFLYNNFQRNDDVIFIEPFQSDTIQIDDLVLISPFNTILQQAIFNNSGIKLRVFYTEVN